MQIVFLSCTLLATVYSEGVVGPFSDDFKNWLNTNGYSADDFVRLDYGSQGSYGGKKSASENITKTPLIMCHGNSDTALQTNSFSTGWDATILVS